MSSRNLYLLTNIEYIHVIYFIMAKTFYSFFSITIILIVIILIYASLGMQIFKSKLLSNTLNNQQWNFDSIEQAINTVFDIITLDDWIGVIINSEENKISSFGSIFFVLTLIIIGNFIVLNLFITIMLFGFESMVITENEESKIIADDKNGNIITKYLANKVNNFDLNNSENSEYEEQSHKSNNDEYSSNDSNYNNNWKNNFNNASLRLAISKELINDSKEISNLKNQLITDFFDDSLFFFSRNSKIRQICKTIVENYYFLNVFYFMILISAFIISLDTFFEDGNEFHNYANYIKYVLNSFFTFEVVCKIISLGFIFGKSSYLREFLNIIDFLAIFGFYFYFFTSDSVYPVLRVIFYSILF